MLTTHYMHEAEVLCDRLVIMDQGEIKAEGSPQKLIQNYGSGFVAIFASLIKEDLQSALTHFSDLSFKEESSGLYVRGPKLENLFLLQEKLKVSAMQIRPTNLEDVFLNHTGQGLSDDA